MVAYPVVAPKVPVGTERDHAQIASWPFGIQRGHSAPDPTTPTSRRTPCNTSLLERGTRPSLMPMGDRLTERLQATAELVNQLERSGDDVTTPRPVDHFVTVSRRRADALCADLEALGFRIDHRSGLLRANIEFTRENAVDAETAAAFTREIVGVVERHGADYDGWGAMSLPGDGELVGEPEDAMAPGDVPVEAEQDRLREVFAERLIADDCPPDLARHLGRSLKLEVGREVWNVSHGRTVSGISVPYSPSQATQEAEELADDVIDDNSRRRKPQW